MFQWSLVFLLLYSFPTKFSLACKPLSSVSFTLRCPVAQRTQVHTGKHPHLEFLLVNSSSSNTLSPYHPMQGRETEAEDARGTLWGVSQKKASKPPIKTQPAVHALQVLQAPSQDPQVFPSPRLTDSPFMQIPTRFVFWFPRNCCPPCKLPARNKNWQSWEEIKKL